MFKDVVEEQLYLLDMGVSFDYTDKIDSISRKDLIQIVSMWREKHKRDIIF